MNINEMLKAISDSKRFKILELISQDNMCACAILKHFDISQPTLFHDLNILQKASLINCNKDKQGKCKMFSINKKAFAFLISHLNKIKGEENE